MKYLDVSSAKVNTIEDEKEHNITMKQFLLINNSLMQNIQYWISTSPSQTSFDGYDLYLKGVKIIKFVMINYDFYS